MTDSRGTAASASPPPESASTGPATATAPLPLLADPARYRACESDLARCDVARTYWIALYIDHATAMLMRHARDAGDPAHDHDEAAPPGPSWAAVCEAARRAMCARFRAAGVAAAGGRSLTLLDLEAIRAEVLGAYRIGDPYRRIKAAENGRALAALPARLQQVRSIADPARRGAALLEGLLAGNLFDLGTPLTMDAFDRARAGDPAPGPAVPPRPWRLDDVDAFHRWLRAAPPGHAVMLVDNAGPDVVLGALPFAQDLAERGWRVTLGANERPSLNDITAAELEPILAAARGSIAAGFDPAHRITVRSTGNAAPLIDLAHVDPDFARHAADASLLVLLGMGRALESNWRARFTVPVLRVAMVKDPEVARTIGAGVLDAIVRFDTA